MTRNSQWVLVNGLARWLLAPVLLLLILSACSGIPIAYYDATTYTQLTGLKAETTLLVDSFDTKPFSVNQDKIEAATLALRKTYEYEKGKGDPNSDTTKQIELISRLFLDDVKEYQAASLGDLGPRYFQEAAIVLGQAFDVAIATENLKNRDKR